MENKVIIGIIIGAIALAAVAIFATMPVGDVLSKFSSTPSLGNIWNNPVRVTARTAQNIREASILTCGHYCTKDKYGNCADAAVLSTKCTDVGCTKSCYDYWSKGDWDTYVRNDLTNGECSVNNADVCVGETGQPGDKAIGQVTATMLW
jgi:hypothetical protein